MSAIRTIDDHIELESIGVNTHAQIDAHLAANLAGNAQGQMKFWSTASSCWEHTEISELVWDDTNKRIGINKSNPSCKFHIKDGAILAEGATGGTPISGAGTRLMWIPARGAFRVGTVTGDQWDSANIGSYSIAGGYNCKASGVLSGVLSGYNNEVSVMYSGILTGYSNTIEGEKSGILSGQNNRILSAPPFQLTKYTAIVTGYHNLIEGNTLYAAILTGYHNKVSSSYSAVVTGRDNEVSGMSSAILQGEFNKVAGNVSFAGGKYMQLSATAYNSFVFGHHSSAVVLTQPNTFYIFPGGTTGKVAVGTVTPATSAIMDLTSTIGALLLPRMTTAQRDALTAINGMLLYNLTLNKFQGYENGVWTNLI